MNDCVTCATLRQYPFFNYWCAIDKFCATSIVTVPL